MVDGGWVLRFIGLSPTQYYGCRSDLLEKHMQGKWTEDEWGLPVTGCVRCTC